MRSRLTYPHVVSTLALVVALGGTSYAAVKLPADSVGARQIKTGAVTNAEVRRGSLRASAFRSGALRPGPTGPSGTADARIQAAIYPAVGIPVEASGPIETSGVAYCEPDEVVIGGGVKGAGQDAVVVESAPAPAKDSMGGGGWSGTIRYAAKAGDLKQFPGVVAVCAPAG